MRRRSLLQALILVFCTPLAVYSDDSETTPTAERPNILLIMLDDLGYSDLGCYGSPIIETPTIDRLAEEGLRFSQFYNTAKCHSSRICLLTGLYPFQAGNRSMNRAVTLAEVLGKTGYFTAMTGKWHLKSTPTERGFDRYFGHLSGATNFFTGDETFRLNGAKFDDFGEDFYTTDADTDYAIRFIDEALRTDRPFFAYIAYNAPHYPLQAPKENVLKYRGRFKQVGWDELRRRRYRRQIEMGLVKPQWELSPRPDYIPAWNELSSEQQDWEDFRMATFAAMVDRVDQNLGRLIDHLKEKGAWENTLLLLCSDNGACPFERTRGRDHKPWQAGSYWTYDVGWAHVGNTPFRWYKQNQHEGGIATPLIVHWPHGLKAAPDAISHEPGHLIDIMPTLVDAAGAEYPRKYGGREIEPAQGRSLLPVLKGRTRKGHDWLYFLFADNRAIRSGDWKLVSAEDGRWELYNMDDDRTELHNMAGEKPELAEELRRLWHHAAREVDGAPANRRRPVSDRPPKTPFKRARATAASK